MNKVWVVVGESGEYSDYSMWVVAVYDNKEQAELCIKYLEEEVKALKIRTKQWLKDNPSSINYKTFPKHKYDSEGNRDTKYKIEELPLFVHFDEHQEYLGL